MDFSILARKIRSLFYGRDLFRFENQHPKTSKPLFKLQQRLAGLIHFLDNTTILKQGQSLYLNELPWHLIIGPPKAGKSTLLAKSDVHYILRKQGRSQREETDKSVDWWITRDSCLIDIPGEFLFSPLRPGTKQPRSGTLWRCFLKLIRQWRGNNSICSVTIALSVSDLLRPSFSALLNQLTSRLLELQHLFPNPIPCQLVITQCDQLIGFNEFFADISREDVGQPFCLLLTNTLDEQFTSLISRLNRQLLERLHHEHDARARCRIKDFPLSLETLRAPLQQLTRRLCHSSFAIKPTHLFFTSACQTDTHQAEQPSQTNDLIVTAEQALAIINSPKQASRPYFIRHFVNHFLPHIPAVGRRARQTTRRVLYLSSTAIAASLLSLVFFLLGQDLNRGNDYLYQLRLTVSQYDQRIQRTADPSDRLHLTLSLLNQMQLLFQSQTQTHPWPARLAWYSNDAKQKTVAIYSQSLQFLLRNEIAQYLSGYLAIPINKNTDDVYATLKAYLMLGDPTHFEASYVSNVLIRDLPSSFSQTNRTQLLAYMQAIYTVHPLPLPLNQARINVARQYLASIPPDKLALIILKNSASNNAEQSIDLGTNTLTAVLTTPISNQIPAMYTRQAFSTVYQQQALTAVNEAVQGNWVLGALPYQAIPNNTLTALVTQLQTSYVSHYIDLWESLLANIHLVPMTNLGQVNQLIDQLVSNQSPFLQLLQTFYTNTYFEPIASNSPRLYSLDALMEKNPSAQARLYQLFTGLTNLRQYLQRIELAPDKNKAAFDLLSLRMHDTTATNPITQLKLVASYQPEPIKSWLNEIADNTLRLLMVQAGQYIDISWQQQVWPAYQQYIANRFPFSTNAATEVNPAYFAYFFGNPGVITHFYQTYLSTFIDTSKPEWHWKSLDNTPLPFAADTVRAIQQAMQIHHAFFPNNDNKLYVMFTVQPYEVDDVFKRISLSINNKVFIDSIDNSNTPHTFAWPGESDNNQTTIQLTSSGDRTIQQTYPGAWGWFKFINQSYDSVIDKKEIIINLSKNNNAAKYAVFTNGTINPLLTTNLDYFHLPNQFTQG